MATSADTALSSCASNLSESKRSSFLATFRSNQAWPLPDCIIYYMAKNPSTAKAYEKMIQCCKYFFIKKSILVAPKLYFIQNAPLTSICEKSVSFKNVSTKIWPKDELCVLNNHGDVFNVSSIIPKLHKSDVKCLTLWESLTIPFKDFIFLASKCEQIKFYNVAITHENGSDAALENLIEVLPYVESFEHLNFDGPKVISSKTVENILKIPHFLNLIFFEMVNISEDFDIDLFYNYIKRNKKTRIDLQFFHPLSEAYITRLQAIVDEIVETENHDYKVPCLGFPESDQTSAIKLFKLYMP